jgi:hypothetical protein
MPSARVFIDAIALFEAMNAGPCLNLSVAGSQALSGKRTSIQQSNWLTA